MLAPFSALLLFFLLDEILRLTIPVRSPMAEAYLEHLKAAHPPLASHFSRVLSAGLSVAKLGVALPAGLGLMLRDCGISENFVHTSRRIERRDVEKYEYVLVMNSRQIEDILAFWPSREEAEQQGIAATNNTVVREDIEGKIHLLGSFGNEGMREVSLPESIGGEYWFQMGTRRIYPGYDKCWSEIKKYVADFIFDLTGYDVNSHAEHSADDNSREVSEDESEDYGEAFLNMSHNPWADGEERSPFDELSKTITSSKFILYFRAHVKSFEIDLTCYQI
jgi:protein-tyrosine-phosphatase